MRTLIVLLMFLIPAGLSLAQASEPVAAPKGMTSSQILAGLLSHDPARKDRAAVELKTISEETAHDMGANMLRHGVRECQTVLGALATANNANAFRTAMYALDSDEYEVRSALLDVVTRTNHKTVSDVSSSSMNPKRLEALRVLIEDGRYVRRYCEGIDPSSTAPSMSEVEQLQRLMFFLDRHLGKGALPAVLTSCTEVMLGEPTPASLPGNAGKDEVARRQSALEQASKLRRAGASVFELIWIESPAKQKYVAGEPYDSRKKAITGIREGLDGLKDREVQYGELSFTGERYGDYLMKLALRADVPEPRAAAVLRLQWWRGDDVVIHGEGYAEAVDKFNALSNRETRALLSELKKWWVQYRTSTDS